jgi:hypothetical protein
MTSKILLSEKIKARKQAWYLKNKERICEKHRREYAIKTSEPNLDKLAREAEKLTHEINYLVKIRSDKLKLIYKIKTLTTTN